VPAFNDRTCEACHESYGWQGELADCPDCPHCGAAPQDAEAMAQVDRLLEVKRAEVLAKVEAEWASRTPEQDAAHRAGTEAGRTWTLAPKVGKRAVGSWVTARQVAWRAAELHEDLRRWFNWGWSVGEDEGVDGRRRT
jgi:hypothetical protein